MFEKDSPIWPILKYLAVGSMAIYAVSHGYQEGWVAKSDIPVILQILLGLVGIDGVKFFTQKVIGKNE